jgi:asparagine synthase (glutamine-hydrolysing)
LGVSHLLSIEVREKLMNEDVAGPLMEQIEEHPDLPPIEKCLMLDKRFFLADHNLIYTDKMAMAAGVEVRVPFLDLEMLRFAAEIPVKIKHRFWGAAATLDQRGYAGFIAGSFVSIEHYPAGPFRP